MFRWLRRILPDRYALNAQEEKIFFTLRELTEALKTDDQGRIDRLRQALNEERKIVQ